MAASSSPIAILMIHAWLGMSFANSMREKRRGIPLAKPAFPGAFYSRLQQRLTERPHRFFILGQGPRKRQAD